MRFVQLNFTDLKWPYIACSYLEIRCQDIGVSFIDLERGLIQNFVLFASFTLQVR